MTSSTSLFLIRQLEDCALRAWPAFRTIEKSGYILRLAGGYTNRANSVNALKPTPYTYDSFEEVRKLAEEVYKREDLPTSFRITPLCDPRVDEHLAKAGYEKMGNELVVMTIPFIDLNLDSSSSTTSSIPKVSDKPSKEWLEAFGTMSNQSSERRLLHEKILNLMEPERIFVSLYSETEIVACGVGLYDEGMLGILDILVQEGSRGKGYGRELMKELLGWGKDKWEGTKGSRDGAGDNSWEGAYLMVSEPNLVARRLYGRLGFRDLYRYHFRKKVDPVSKVQE